MIGCDLDSWRVGFAGVRAFGAVRCDMWVWLRERGGGGLGWLRLGKLMALGGWGCVCGLSVGTRAGLSADKLIPYP